MVHCNTGFILHSNILLMQLFRVFFVNVGRYAEPHNPCVLLYSILCAFTFASILAYSTWCIDANILTVDAHNHTTRIFTKAYNIDI